MYELDKQNFGKFIAGLRKEKRLTQKELAAQLHISDKAVSKWETGVSVPDVSLLIPLGEALGVTVTELLECRRMEHTESMTAGQVEEIVKTTIRMNRESEPPQRKKKRIFRYLVCVALAGAELAALVYLGHPPESWSVTLLLCEIFGVVFGAYFMIICNPRLPDYYDQNKISFVGQYGFKLNIPGVYFNNRNWPHILHAGRVWSMSILLIYPLIYFLFVRFLPTEWMRYENFASVPVAFTIFIPIFYMGKKYE